jgi:hypothetical protein
VGEWSLNSSFPELFARSGIWPVTRQPAVIHHFLAFSGKKLTRIDMWICVRNKSDQEEMFIFTKMQ